MTAIRRPGAVSAAVLVGLMLGFSVAHTLAPKWSRNAGLDVWNLPLLQEQLQEASVERDAVTVLGERSEKRREAAKHIIKCLADGMALSTGADELMEVFKNDVGVRITLKTVFYDIPNERHRFARHAIDRVRTFLQSDPKRLEFALVRLEAEYKLLDCSPELPTAR